MSLGWIATPTGIVPKSFESSLHMVRAIGHYMGLYLGRGKLVGGLVDIPQMQGGTRHRDRHKRLGPIDGLCLLRQRQAHPPKPNMSSPNIASLLPPNSNDPTLPGHSCDLPRTYSRSCVRLKSTHLRLSESYSAADRIPLTALAGPILRRLREKQEMESTGPQISSLSHSPPKAKPSILMILSASREPFAHIRDSS